MSVPHGGYTTSILYRTAAVHFARYHESKKIAGRPQEPIGFQISFLRRTLTGRAILSVQEMKLGARVSTINVTLSQKPGHRGDLEVKLVACITLSPPDAEIGPTIDGTWDLSPPVPPGSLPDNLIDFKKLSEEGREGVWERGPQVPPELHALKHVKLFSPSHTLLTQTLKDRTKQVVDQWAQFTPGGKRAKWSNEAVVFLTDVFPAGLIRLGAMEASRLLAIERGREIAKRTIEVGFGRFWYPTLTMNIDLKTRLPPEGVEWLHSRVVTRMLRGSRADLDVVILDQKGELVSTSTQVALVVDGSRNTKGRQEREKL